MAESDVLLPARFDAQGRRIPGSRARPAHRQAGEVHVVLGRMGLEVAKQGVELLESVRPLIIRGQVVVGADDDGPRPVADLPVDGLVHGIEAADKGPAVNLQDDREGAFPLGVEKAGLRLALFGRHPDLLQFLHRRVDAVQVQFHPGGLVGFGVFLPGCDGLPHVLSAFQIIHLQPPYKLCSDGLPDLPSSGALPCQSYRSRGQGPQSMRRPWG